MQYTKAATTHSVSGWPLRSRIRWLSNAQYIYTPHTDDSATDGYDAMCSVHSVGDRAHCCSLECSLVCVLLLLLLAFNDAAMTRQGFWPQRRSVRRVFEASVDRTRIGTRTRFATLKYSMYIWYVYGVCLYIHVEYPFICERHWVAATWTLWDGGWTQ